MKRILSISLMIMLCFTVMLAFISCGGNAEYDRANSLFEQGKYDEALSIYESIGNGTRALVASKMSDMQDGEFKNAIKAILGEGMKVTIKYDVNGGDMDGGNSKLTFSYTKPTEFRDVKEIEKDGYEFSKWDVVSAKFTEDGSLELSLKALFDPEMYEINYNLNGGTLTSGIEEYPFGTETTLVNPTKTGYTFTGWTGEGIDTPALEVKIPADSTGEREYTANWQANTYQVSLNPDGGTVESSSVDVDFGSYYELPAATKEGFRFGGWYLENTKIDRAGEWTVADGVTLKAKWLPRYTISILGDSISSYNGISNDATINSGLATHPAYYSDTDNDMDKSDLDSVNDTYWMAVANALNLEVCVPNGCAASRVTNTIPDAPGYENVKTGAARANQLHRDGSTELYPDIIFVLLGTNDIGGGVSVEDFKPAYRALLESIQENYPDAKIYVGTLLPQNRGVTQQMNDAYNTAIKSIADILNITVVDIAAESGITFDNYLSYTADGLHPNKAGMSRVATCLFEAIKKDFPQE